MASVPMTVLPKIRPILMVAGVSISILEGSPVFFFKAGMAIDADGAPTAYHPVHGRGLDNLANAGHEGNWYGVVTDNGHKNGKPVLQGPNDPAPGFYVSPTALQNKHLPRTDSRRYVNSVTVPYISLPGHHGSAMRASLGDLAMVINGHSGRRCAAIYADVGPRGKIGEGSIALAAALGLSNNARHGGTSSQSIIYIVFPHSGSGSMLSPSSIHARGDQLFEEWGGLKQVRACFPEFATHLH
jgi:Fungal chitosanase of glycosyl hydrolase group 75